MLFTRSSIALLTAALAVNAATIKVTVAPDGDFAFDPSAVTANVGDIVSFTWASGGHTVTQGPVPETCKPLSGGFDSKIQKAKFVYNVTVKSTDPISVHCRPHCTSGMKMTINAKTEVVPVPTIFQAYVSNPIHAAVNCLKFF